jgi:peptidoglycan hydrolase CwlO-like protein
MNKPNRNEFDEKDIYKYVTLFEEYTDELEREIEEWREKYEWEANDAEELLSEIKDLNTEISQLKDQIVGEDSILDAMTIDWLKQSNNWEIVKQMALKQN